MNKYALSMFFDPGVHKHHLYKLHKDFYEEQHTFEFIYESFITDVFPDSVMAC